MGTNHIITALTFHRCGEVSLSKTSVMDEFVSYDFPTGEFYGLSEEVQEAKKGVRDLNRPRRH